MYANALSMLDNTLTNETLFLLEGVCIRLTWHLHNHAMTYVMNMKEVLCMFMTTVIKCRSVMTFLMQIW